MAKIAIRAEGVSKKYQIGGPRASYGSLREVLMDMAALPLRRFTAILQNQAAITASQTLWALKDVAFEIQQGEVVAVIGHNGAGKSTLLKILSRITAPTEGKITLYGRVGSLLEVGTGFHGELTGRENIYLNGAILGMKRHEIQRKFDEIVAFSEIEKFIDTPVKFYSTGMGMRLAFSVAAHLEAEILLVDEVLAVGDYAFQQKCLGKTTEVSQQGRTVLLVSHNMGAVSRFCQSGILLQNGQIYAQGEIKSLITHYLSLGAAESGLVRPNVGTEAARITEVGIQNEAGEFTTYVGSNHTFYIWVGCEIQQQINNAQMMIEVLTTDGTVIFVTTHTDMLHSPDFTLMPGIYQKRVHIPGHFLNQGVYMIHLRILGNLAGEHRASHADAFHVLQFRVVETGSVATKFNDERRGLVTPLLTWEEVEA